MEEVEQEIASGAAETNGSQPSGGLIDALRARREELQKERHLDLDVPGYRGLLVVRYKPIDWDWLKKIGERADRNYHPRKELMAMVDVLVKSCDSVWTRDQGELKPVDPEGAIVRFDEQLAAILGFESQSARKTLLATFNNDLAVTAQYNTVSEWMQNVDLEVDEELLGE